MGQNRTDLLRGKPKATASSNSPGCCKGTSPTTPVRIPRGDPHAFLHVSCHPTRCLLSLSHSKWAVFQGSPKCHFLPATPGRSVCCPWDQFLSRTTATSPPTSPPAASKHGRPHPGSAALQSRHSHGDRGEESLYPMWLTIG